VARKSTNRDARSSAEIKRRAILKIGYAVEKNTVRADNRTTHVVGSVLGP
jgi:hypothetical protein